MCCRLVQRLHVCVPLSEDFLPLKHWRLAERSAFSGSGTGAAGLRLQVSSSWCFNLASVSAGCGSKGQESFSVEAQRVNASLGAKGEL